MGLQSQTVATVSKCWSTHAHDCLFPYHISSTAYFHSDTENSFNLPFSLSYSLLFFFPPLTAYLPHTLALSMWALHATTLLNCPTNVVAKFPSFRLRATMRVFWWWLCLHHSTSTGWCHHFLQSLCMRVVTAGEGLGAAKALVGWKK